MPEYQTSPGTRDILAPDSTRWRRLVEVFAEVVESAGFGQIIPPMFEDLGVFLRLGEATDIVTKEMYDFEDKGGRRVALRPEMTAGVVRAFVQHRPLLPWKAWYAGPNFRYEKAQQGRYRQFDQVGVEVLGVDDPHLDAEVISLAWEFYGRLGLRQVRLVVNSLGEPEDRSRYVDALRLHFSKDLAALSPESRQTLERNPLRVLDSKREQDAPLVAAAPVICDFYSADAAEHFASVLAGLDRLAIPYEVRPSLVRGLDYYRKTTFEFIGAALESSQNAVGGGGRYDGLVEDLGGPSTPGIGFALGVDRTLLECDAEGVFGAPATPVSVFVVDVTGGAEALTLTHDLRSAGIASDRAYEGRSMKSQMKAADRSGATFAIIIGGDELASGAVTVRPLAGQVGDDRTQSTIPRTELIPMLKRVLPS
ncbi:MAG: histidine--tRNA ligase [Actinobacteria bacterium]|nr:histidine--tRNA ligase [Actinomycetota bacterium]